MRLKRYLAWLVAGIMAFASTFAVYAADDLEAAEMEVQSGTIDLCSPGEIYINENFDGGLPGTDTGYNATWDYGGPSAISVTDGTLAFSGVKDASASVTPTVPLKYDATKPDSENMYVLNFDFKRIACTSGGKYDLQMAFDDAGTAVKKTPLASYYDEATSTFVLKTIGNATIASGLSLNSWYSVTLVYAFKAEGSTYDVTITDKSTGEVKGTLTNQNDVNMAEASQITKVTFFGFTDNPTQYDNIQLYKYKSAEIDTSIIDPGIPGTPENVAETNIIDENFDAFPDVTTTSYTGTDGTRWAFWSGAAKKAEAKTLSSGRKALKLSGDVSTWTVVEPEQPITYSPDSGSNNTYVLKFGMKGLHLEEVNKSADLLRINNQPLLNMVGAKLRTAVTKNRIKLLEEKWYTMAIVFQVGETSVTADTYVMDDGTVQQLDTETLETGGISQLRFSTADGTVLYMDNLQLYQASATEQLNPAVPKYTIGNVNFSDIDLTNVAAKTDVLCSANFTMTSAKKAGTPIGIVAIYQMQEDNMVFEKMVTVALNAGGGTTEYIADADAPLFTSDADGGCYVVKLFVWDSFSSITPCAEAYSSQ